MKIFGIKWTFVCTALALLSGGLFIPTPALAQIPTNGVFYGCIRIDRDGDEGRLVRLVAASEACKRNETRISWNQQGPAGTPGAKGDKGDAGTPGTNGTNGADGATGSTGEKGDKGDAGSDAQVVGEGSNGGGNITFASNDAQNNNGNVIVTKQAKGFRGYVAWAAIAVRVANVGGLNNATSVTCAIKQTTPSLNGGAPMVVDVRSVSTILPPTVGASVLYNIALVGDSPGPANDGSEVSTFSVVCGYNGSFPATPTNVNVPGASLVVMGIGNTFEIPNN